MIHVPRVWTREYCGITMANLMCIHSHSICIGITAKKISDDLIFKTVLLGSESK